MDNPESLAFSVELLWDGGTSCQVNIEGHEPLRLGLHPQFGGEGEHLCPDELFLASIGGCLLTTFLYASRKLRLHLSDLKTSVHGEVVLQGPEGYRLTSVEASINVKTAKGEEAKAEECFRLTRDFCHLTRLIEDAVPVRLSVKVESEG